MTTRKIAVYAGALALIIFANPWLPTFMGGCLLLLLAGSLRIWTFGHLAKNQAMVTTGPFAYTRNPAYLGSLLALAGFGLAAGNPFSVEGLFVWALTGVFLVVFVTRYLPRKFAREYPRLQALYPEQYAAHAANVPDFFPRLRPWRSGDTRAFSWRLVNTNHELFWPIVVTLCMAAIWFL